MDSVFPDTCMTIYETAVSGDKDNNLLEVDCCEHPEVKAKCRSAGMGRQTAVSGDRSLRQFPKHPTGDLHYRSHKVV